MVVTIEERVFLVEYAFREGNRYTDLVQEQFAEKFPETLVPHRNAVYRDRPRTLNELKSTITAYIRNISQADLQKVFANIIKRVQAYIDAREHHLQHLL
jgi:23S rRNA maturation-related 3'-5' exoribonuclease YhaM